VAPEHIRSIIPLRKNHEENVKVLREEFDFRGVSVIISARECIQTASRHRKEGSSENKSKEKKL
jgi:indolepyruvate ferredoxin oxidoreductase alpha subunit